MNAVSPTPKTVKNEARKTLTREDWIAAARAVLETRGIADVKADRLSKHLKVTRGSFYFHFTGIEDLHTSLLDQWRQCNCKPFQSLGSKEPLDGLEAFEAVVRIWVDEVPFSPMLDLAIRGWSRTSMTLAKEVAEMDDLRIRLLTRAFRAMSYGEDESLVRARITYFHQIGYYALSFKETAAERKRYQPLYGKILVGPSGARE